MADRPGEAELCDRISRLIEGAPLLSADDFAKEALPLLMEADNELDRLTARLSEAERERDEAQQWCVDEAEKHDATKTRLARAERRLSDYEQALRGLLGRVDYHLSSGSALFPAFQNAVDVARAALSSDQILTKDGTDSN